MEFIDQKHLAQIESEIETFVGAAKLSRESGTTTYKEAVQNL